MSANSTDEAMSLLESSQSTAFEKRAYFLVERGRGFIVVGGLLIALILCVNVLFTGAGAEGMLKAKQENFISVITDELYPTCPKPFAGEMDITHPDHNTPGCKTCKRIRADFTLFEMSYYNCEECQPGYTLQGPLKPGWQSYIKNQWSNYQYFRCVRDLSKTVLPSSYPTVTPTSSPTSLANTGFDLPQSNIARAICPSFWTCYPREFNSEITTGVVIVPSGDATWDGAIAPAGNQFIALLSPQTFITRRFPNFIVGVSYKLTFYAASSSVTQFAPLQVSINYPDFGPGDVLMVVNEPPLQGKFKLYSVVFTAKSTSIKLNFRNAGSLLGVACFLDDVSWVFFASRNLDVSSPVASSGSVYACPTGWTCSPNNVVLIQSGNIDWGGTASPDGQQFVGLRNAGGESSSISHIVSGLVVGNAYKVSFYSASRNGFPQSQIELYAIRLKILSDSPAVGRFQQHEAAFVATSISVSLAFVNTYIGSGDSTCFVGGIKFEEHRSN